MHEAGLTVVEVLRRSAAWLAERGVDSPRLDAEILIAHALGVGRLDLYLQHDRPLDPDELARIRELVRARGKRRPVAYLVGHREFFALDFLVDERVLVPRPETEDLVVLAVERLRDRDAPEIADVGTGSGCIAVSVLHALPGARAHATDRSAGAVEVARENAERHGVAERLTLHVGDLLEPLRGTGAWGRLDAVLCNPPYVVRGDPAVEPDVREHEPADAVFVPGDDPLAVLRRAAEQAGEALAPGGLVAFEVGAGQAPAACGVLERLGFRDVAARRDLARIDRVVWARAPTRPPDAGGARPGGERR